MTCTAALAAPPTPPPHQRRAQTRLGALAWRSCTLAALVLLGVVGLRLTGWSRGPLPAVLLVGLPIVLAGFYPLALLALLGRRRLLGGLALLGVTAHLLVLAPGLGAARLPDSALTSPRIKLVSTNVLRSNPTPEAAVAALARSQPDVLVIAELSAPVLAELDRQGLLAALPHTTLVRGPRSAPRDVEVFSRWPLTEVGRAPAPGGETELADPSAVIRVGGVRVRIRGTHPLPPIGRFEPLGRQALQTLRAELEAEELPVVVAGDLNADRDQPLFHDLLEVGMRDAAEERGRGLSRTWPQHLPLLALDHILVRSGAEGRLHVLEQSEIAVPGSDHLGVVAEIAVEATRGAE